MRSEQVEKAGFERGPRRIGGTRAAPEQPRAIEGNLKRYLGARDPTARFASFDYCFNHFQAHRGPRLAELASSSGMELSCLHLGFFLASWGMFRGSSTLLQRSIRYYEPVVEAIASTEAEVWDIDAHAYTDCRNVQAGSRLWRLSLATAILIVQRKFYDEGTVVAQCPNLFGIPNEALIDGSECFSVDEYVVILKAVDRRGTVSERSPPRRTGARPRGQGSGNP
jgi:hypothetical protein